MPKISVLMPVYNAETFVENAINSVLDQSYDNWELIIIDDNSTDLSGDICDRLAKTDTRIKVFHMSENLGISGAKNMAIKMSTGEYIAFCDDDDLMEKDTLSDNMEIALRNNSEVVRWSYKTIKVDENNHTYAEIDCKCMDGVYRDREEIFNSYRNVHTMLSCDWTGLYKKSLLDEHNILFPTDFKYGGEDTMFNVEILNYVNSMSMNSRSYYCWYLRKKHSTTTKHNTNFCYSMLKVAQAEKNIIISNCRDDGLFLWEEYREFYKKLLMDYTNHLSEKEKARVMTEIDNQL